MTGFRQGFGDIFCGSQPDVTVFVVVYVDFDSSGYSTSGGVKEVRRAVAAVPINLIVLGLSLVCGLGERKGGEGAGGRGRGTRNWRESIYLLLGAL